MLGSLRITGFRAFSDLTIERLGRVTLAVGKNNVGKTTLLEAVHLHASTALPRPFAPPGPGVPRLVARAVRVEP